MDDNQKEAILTSVAQEWERTHDIGAIHRLAGATPECAVEIYDLFALLADIEVLPDEPLADRERADARTRQFLEAKGYALAAAGRRASTPTTSPSPLQALKEATGKSLTELANAMRVTPAFLLRGFEVFAVFPPRAQEEFLARADAVSGLGAGRVRELVTHQLAAPMPMAAKRVRDAPGKITYDQLVAEAGLEAISADEPRFWLSLKDAS